MKNDFLIKALIIGAIIIGLLIMFGVVKVSADDGAVSVPAVIESATLEIVAESQAMDITTPPVWLADIMRFVERVPVIGPIAIEVFKWIGVIAAIFTALVTCLLSITRTLFMAASLSSLAPLMAWVTKFEEGKLMNWLKYFSIYNAKKE